jgi:hypothetical protein
MYEKKWKYSEEVHQLFIDFKKAYDSVKREVLYKILLEFSIPRKLVRKFYKGIKELNRPYQSESVTIKDEYGKSLMEQK